MDEKQDDRRKTRAMSIVDISRNFLPFPSSEHIILHINCFRK